MLLFTKKPYLQMPTCDGITIIWETTIEASSCVIVYPVELMNNHYRSPVSVDKPQIFKGQSETCIHIINVTGLEKGQLYYYKVISTNSNHSIESSIYSFVTAIDSGTPFSFAVTAETGGFADTILNKKLFDLIGNYRPDFLLLLGDLVHDGHVYDDWSRYFFSPAENLLSNTPYYACVGNNEHETKWFYKFNAFPKPMNYYSFDYGDVHFTCLDSSAFVDVDNQDTEKMQFGQSQFDFLVEDLQKTTKKWKIVFFHYPPYVSADFEIPAMRALCPVLEKYGVKVVFNSHTILYERSHPLTNGKLDEENGIHYLVCGGAGAFPEWFRPKREWHTAQALAIPHFVQVIVTPKTLRFVAISHEGMIFDILDIK